MAAPVAPLVPLQRSADFSFLVPWHVRCLPTWHRGLFFGLLCGGGGVFFSHLPAGSLPWGHRSGIRGIQNYSGCACTPGYMRSSPAHSCIVYSGLRDADYLGGIGDNDIEVCLLGSPHPRREGRRPGVNGQRRSQVEELWNMARNPHEDLHTRIPSMQDRNPHPRSPRNLGRIVG